jgi:pilus assembly protein CpaF
LAVRLNLLVVGPRDGAAEQLLTALVGSHGDGRVVWVGEALGGQQEARLEANLESPDGRRALALKAAMPALRFAAQLSSAEIATAVTELVVSGVDGALALRYAPSSKRALLRLAAEIATTRPGIGLAAARELVAGAYDVVVEVARLRDERVRVLRVAELTGVRADEIELQDIFTFVPDRTAAGGAVEGTFVPSGNVPHLVETLRARGENLDSAIFSRPPSR